MTESPQPSARRTQLLELAYQYALDHGLAAISLRPLANAIGSSPRVLLYLFGSKDGLVRELLWRARQDELALLAQLRPVDGTRVPGLDVLVERLWSWLSAPRRRSLLVLWVEGYGRSLREPGGPWSGFATETVHDWLTLLAGAQPESIRETAEGQRQRTAALAMLRGALLDLLATGDEPRVTAAVRAQSASLG